ncbi:MAG: FAD-dependent oxidoreductase [Cyclobacteriaceae bacterium]
MKRVDFLIIGQGIAGTLLSMELLSANKSCHILNKETENTSSNKAGGLYNPITGRKMVKTWLADELFESLESYYSKLEEVLGTRFLYPKPIYRPFFSVEEQNDWQGKVSQADFRPYVKTIHLKSIGIEGVNDPFGGLELSKCGSVDIPTLIMAARKFFQDKGNYSAEVFDYNKLEEKEDGISYKDISAKTIIFCEGPDAVDNPFFKNLPFKLVKGEILDIETNLPVDRVINRGVFVLPKNGIFKVGSTYDHNVIDHEPTEKGRKNISERLEKIYSKQYKIVKHTAGVRPSTYDRRPFIGMTGKYDRVGIFNGFGTKGVSLAPFFATQFVNYLLRQKDIYQEVLLQRVDK